MINKNSRKNFSLKAFSLIEISVVIVIIGILIAGVSKGLDLYQDFKLTTARQLTKNSIVPRINDLRLWLDATTENAIINQNNSLNIKDGDTVKSFRDMNLSGFSGYSFTQDTTSYQPKYTKNGINDLPCIYFDSNNQNLRLIATIKENFSLESTIFAVVYMDSINPSNNNQAMLISVGGSYGAMEM